MKEPEIEQNSQEELALLDGAISGDIVMVSRCLNSSVSPNTPDMRGSPWGITPLMHAAEKGHIEIVRLLLKAKAKPNLVDKDFPGEGGGQTALHYAARGGRVEIGRILVAAKADFNKVAKAAGTALSVAARNGQTEFVKFLLESKADPNITDSDIGLSPICVAIMYGHSNLIEILTAGGADVNLPNRCGTTPFMWSATRLKPHESIRLIARGVNLDATENDGTTCLMWAVLSEHPELVEVVIRNGVSINALNKVGESALDIAARSEIPKIISLLESAGAKRGSELVRDSKLFKRMR